MEFPCKQSYIYIQYFSPKHTVCIIKAWLAAATPLFFGASIVYVSLFHAFSLTHCHVSTQTVDQWNSVQELLLKTCPTAKMLSLWSFRRGRLHKNNQKRGV